MRRIAAVLLALISAFALFACGTEGGPVTDETGTCTDTTEATTEPVTEPPAPKEKVIYLAGENGNDDNDGLTPETAVATYEKAFSLLAEDRNRIVITHSMITQNRQRVKPTCQIFYACGAPLIFTATSFIYCYD